MEILLVFKYILLGLFQGITEPIPISSSGHLVIAQHLFGLKIEGLYFELLMNAASLLAVMLIYKHSLMTTTIGLVKYIFLKKQGYKKEFMFVFYLVIATIPAGLIGVMFGDVIGENLKDVRFVGFTLLVTAMALFLIRKLKGRKTDGEISIKDALIIGIAQSFALMPGISRSGATIVAAMGRGVEQATSLKFSFFLYIPVSVGGLVLGVSEFVKSNEFMEMLMPYSLAFGASFIATYFSLKWFMNIMKKGNLIYFSIYCLLVGLAVLLFS